ncbi:hypothetical protein SAMN04489867_3062 [Pedococcus dokdonensis]|uniref:Uncharacterized protein n=1 Tax=Pedococcus dokdonensis TaxID=443156 RepID=A0A1H0U078_9MICO|nr:SdrD B-like domain-containing protein [Pedococcus dokdonensis]SDP59551.1 hypothetical protein SAMN04489867_3062 [Pedococcus dokdonensis]
MSSRPATRRRLPAAPVRILSGIALAAVTAVMLTSAPAGAATPGAISGTVFEDVAGTASASTANGIAGVSVSLWSDSDGDGVLGAGDTLVTTTTTAANGSYTFTGTTTGAQYFVTSAAPTRNAAGTTGMVGEQTYASSNATALGAPGAVRASCVRGTPTPVATTLAASGPCYGGRAPASADVPTSATGARTVTAVTQSSAGVDNVNFGFSFNVVTNTNDTGQGSVRQMMANSEVYPGGNTMRFVPAVAPTDSSGAGSWWTVHLVDSTSNGSTQVTLPIVTQDLVLDGTAHSNVDGSTVVDTAPGTVVDPNTSVGTGSDTVGSIPRPELVLSLENARLVNTAVGGWVTISCRSASADLTLNGISFVKGANGDPNLGSYSQVESSCRLTATNNVFGATPDGAPSTDTVNTNLLVNSGTYSHGAYAIDHNYFTRGSYGLVVRPGSPTVAGTYQADHNYATGLTQAAYSIEGDHWTLSENYATDSRFGILVGTTAAQVGANLVTNNTVTDSTNGASVSSGNIRIRSSANTVSENVSTGATGTTPASGFGVGVDASATGNEITRNEFGGNAANAIDLDRDGVSLNSPDTAGSCTAAATSGANNNIARALIVAVTIDGSGTLDIGGVLCDDASTYRVEVYGVGGPSTGDIGTDGLRAGEGTSYLGAISGVTGGTFTGTFSGTGLAPGDLVSVIVIRTATGGVGAVGDTSEFSPTLVPLEVPAFPIAGHLGHGPMGWLTAAMLLALVLTLSHARARRASAPVGPAAAR